MRTFSGYWLKGLAARDSKSPGGLCQSSSFPVSAVWALRAETLKSQQH